MNRSPILHVLLSILAPILFVAVGFGLFYIGCAVTIGDPFELADTYLLKQRPDFSGELADIYHTTSVQNSQFTGVSVQNRSDSSMPDSTVSASSIDFPSYETVYGRIRCARIGLDAPLIFGDSMNALDHGAAQSMASFIPGYGGTVLVGGHNHTYFHCLQEVKEGDQIQIETAYGVYLYEVRAIKVDDKDNADAYPLTKEREQLILYTCYPFNALGTVSERCFVYADYRSGPKIVQ